jgi:hypothetical protein
MQLMLLLLLIVALLGPAPGMSRDTTARDQKLLSLVFPDVNGEGNAHKSVVIRSLSKDYDTSALEGEMRADIFESLPVSNGKHTDHLLVIDVTHKDDSAHQWGGETLLALFRLTPKPRLLDVVDVRGDRETYFWKMLHAPQHDGVIVMATHLNASEEYVLLDLVEVKADKFVESKVDFPWIYSSKLESSTLTEEPTLKELKNANPPAAIFKVKATAKTFDPDTNAVKKQQSKSFSATLNLVSGRWRCPQCGSMHGHIAILENRFGFRSE